ncbi:hypothetical protein OS493_001586 [Desmophyllum pertusum]|uniref:Uncharacterized protein n=1 Tax=Desmophyllum pertusum TaxID=174260 RepID=A0A9X0D1I5_9CNID|nr:hypothetical protein OS493_001586 [Desmophyllum pertusum]
MWTMCEIRIFRLYPRNLTFESFDIDNTRQEIETFGENKCCQQREYVTSYELFDHLCVDRHVLELAIRARCDIRVEPHHFSLFSFNLERLAKPWELGFPRKDRGID